MEQQQATKAAPEAESKETIANPTPATPAKTAEAKKAEAKLISVAMFMAVVAMLGAVTAYRAALAEQDTLRFERRLQQGQMLELVHRQELLSRISSRTRYENSSNQHASAAASDLHESGELLATNPGEAALKKLQAEEEAAEVRALQPYLNYFRVYSPYESKDDLEASVAYASAIWLRDVGFDTVWNDPGKEGKIAIWEKLEQDVIHGRAIVLRLAIAVVLFVVALAFLTFAQLNHGSPKREKALTAIGGVLACTGLVIAFWVDPGSRIEFLVFTVVFAILAVIGARLARRIHFAAEPEEEEPVHPAEVEPALFAGMRLHTAPVTHKFGRFVISMIALSAVLSACSGYFYSRAAVASSKSMSDALENQADLFRLNSRRVTVWNRIVGKLATAEDYHLRYEAARQRWELAKETPGLLSEQQAEDQVRLRRKALEGFEKSEPRAHQTMTGPMGPEQDVNFPGKLVISRSYHAPAKAVGEWSAHNEEALGYQRRATTYLALLTLFAIALYLLGQSLGMGRTNAAMVLVTFACVLVLAGVAGGVMIHFAQKPIALKTPRPDCLLPTIVPDDNPLELSAEHFARGMVLNDSSPDDSAESAKAAKEFQCAVEIRPAFAVADLYFARATNRASTPQLNEGAFVSLIGKDNLDKVSHAEQEARVLLIQQGFAPPYDLVGNSGFDTYEAGLLKGDRKTVESGRQATLTATKLAPDDLIPRFNLGLAQLAEGDDKAALETYQQAIKVGGATINDNAALIGGALTDLDVFRQYCTNLNDPAYCQRFENTEFPQLKSQLVATAWPFAKGRNRANAGIKFSNPHLDASGSGLGWTGDVERVAADASGQAQDALVLLWYAYSDEWKAWRVLPAISGRVDPRFYARGNPSLFYSVLRSSDARACLQNGVYRADFFVDGDLADTQQITVTNENLHPAIAPDLDVAVCVPPSWQRWQSPDPDEVWARGFVENNNTRGAFVFSFFDPQQEEPDAIKERAMLRAENILRKGNLIPASSAQEKLYECNGLRGLTTESMATFPMSGASSIAKAWITPEGLVNVVIVVDKDQRAIAGNPTHEDCEILVSATTVPPRAYTPSD